MGGEGERNSGYGIAKTLVTAAAGLVTLGFLTIGGSGAPIELQQSKDRLDRADGIKNITKSAEILKELAKNSEPFLYEATPAWLQPQLKKFPQPRYEDFGDDLVLKIAAYSVISRSRDPKVNCLSYQFRDWIYDSELHLQLGMLHNGGSYYGKVDDIRNNPKPLLRAFLKNKVPEKDVEKSIDALLPLNGNVCEMLLAWIAVQRDVPQRDRLSRAIYEELMQPKLEAAKKAKQKGKEPVKISWAGERDKLAIAKMNMKPLKQVFRPVQKAVLKEYKARSAC